MIFRYMRRWFCLVLMQFRIRLVRLEEFNTLTVILLLESRSFEKYQNVSKVFIWAEVIP